MPNQIDNIIIQVRARLQEMSIKLWLEPYYYPEVGSMETELERLADEFSSTLSISVSNCKLALAELQEGALRKLVARKEFEETGLATFTVRTVNNVEGTQNVADVKCPLSSPGEQLQEVIAKKLDINDANRVKCISGGKIVNPNESLVHQGLKNNQQLMVIISSAVSSSSEESMYDRIRKIKMDVESIVDSNRQLFEMEDQDGNPVFLPPTENRALLMAMGYCEKARAAMKRSHYDEALVLLLEADEKFTTCNSKFLESVDNYALVNLDIVWCYLCLKNVTQLPDANRRLEICEKNFRRSYGENMNRLIALKGNACPERALIMRLHLLQGVLCFHQNRRNEAYEKFEIAANELSELKVDDTAVEALVEMGYEPYEARIALRACRGNIGEAVNFIHDRKQKLAEARKRSTKERDLSEKLAYSAKRSGDWVNPRSVNSLVEMGFARNLVVTALRKSDNDLQKALDMLQSNSAALNENLPPKQNADDSLVEQLKTVGFNEEMARVALETSHNDIEKAIDFLVKIFGNEDELIATMERFAKSAAAATASSTCTAGPSTSTGSNSLISKVMKKAQDELASIQAYKRFNTDLSPNENDYLDLPLLQEEQILAEYKRFLEQ